MKGLYYILLGFLLVISISSCKDEGLLIKCECEQNGGYTFNEDSPYAILSPNIVSPSSDSIHHLLFSISNDTASITNEEILLEIDSYLCRVYNPSGVLLFESTAPKLVTNSNRRYASFYLWDGLIDGVPYVGEFHFDLDLGFTNDLLINGKDINVISVSCDQINDCLSGTADCDFTDCRYSEQIVGLSSHPEAIDLPPDVLLNCK